MKTLLKLSAIASIIILIAVGCQKMLGDDAGSTKEFNAAFVREWYYGVFKKSGEFAEYDQKLNRLKEPDWKNGKYRKVGDMEIMEFPLMKERKIISVPSGNSLTSSEKARIANASLTRISFIKLPGKEIAIRELDYIPEWEYLKLKNYDISSVELGSADNKFTGRIIVKKWNNKRLFVIRLNAGKTIKNTPEINKNKMQVEAASGYDGCYDPGATCDYEIICEHVVIGDIWMPPHSCTVGACLGNCTGGEEPGPQCDFNSSVSCECQLYGLNCDGGIGGTEGPINNDDNDGIAEVKEITEDIDDPCLKATLIAVISLGLNNNMTNILHNTFGGTTDFNINFMDNPLNNYMRDGNTSTYISPGGRIDFTVTLNTEVLPDASKEFTAATIYHEIIHAYLRSGGLATGAGLHHNTMANEYVTILTNSLLSAFTNLDPLDAKALAWGGLQDTPAFDLIRVNNPSEYNDLRSRNAQHRVNTIGTPCL